LSLSLSLSLSRFSLFAQNGQATLAGDFSQLRPPFQVGPVPKSSSQRPLSSLVIFAARKLKDWRLERREVSAAAATVAFDVSGHLALVQNWVLILNQSKVIAASHRRDFTSTNMEPEVVHAELVLPTHLSFKRIQMYEKYPKGQSRGRHWKHLKQIIQAENYQNYPPNEPNYVNIESPPSMHPCKRICDITGYEAPYYDPRTGLRYANADIFKLIRSLPNEYVQDIWLSEMLLWIHFFSASIILETGNIVTVVPISSGLGFPPSEDSCPCNAVNPKREGSHPEVTVVGFAHLLHIFEAFGHVSPQLIVHLFFIPQETLDVLHRKTH
ncbi:hypothetical protein Prudu_018676, partial [Prunus dulcis]